ncbi:MAG: low specificity L-threonine aldolase [Oscillospiraceae bacterium]|jgi:threonine aldolase|nr:low specificity L-threonine aldolase [Oscillospiraceae bacterium]
MIRFECDYAEGAHPKILKKLFDTNFEQTPGYGVDEYCERAKNKIKKLCGNENIDVHFLVGGTQANLTVISSILKPYQGVVSAETGHINVHETGAIEQTGHKVITLPSGDGKVTAEQVLDIYNSHFEDSLREHTVQPGMVYISHPTENGTTYTKSELKNLSKACKKCNLPLFLDGARLGYGLMAENNDLSLEDITNLCDIFYIGGTKIGALFGEAVVICNEKFKKDFRYNIKQRGAMLAKGRILGIQFDVLFENDLYFEISKHAVDMAMLIKNAFSQKGFKFLYESSTNQQFPILPNDKLEKLSEKYSFCCWNKIDENHSAARFCTSWATKKEDVLNLIEDIKKL